MSESLFSKSDLGNHYISIKTNKVQETYSSIVATWDCEIVGKTDGELIIRIPESGVRFSLKDLKAICCGKSEVECFLIDQDETGNYIRRYYNGTTENLDLMDEQKNEVELFQSDEYGNLNVIVIDGEPWFIGRQITNILGYTDSVNAIKSHVDKDDKCVKTKAFFKGGNLPPLEIPNRGLTCINESGFYSLVLSSKLPTARKFQRWVTSEVLPTIRKHGAYMTPQKIEEVLLNPDTIIKLAQTLKAEQMKNRELVNTNMALTEKATEWDNKNVINALIRRFASEVCGNNFAAAWNLYYKNLAYKEGISVKMRKESKGKRLIDRIDKKEERRALKVAVALCEDRGINTGEIIRHIKEENICIY